MISKAKIDKGSSRTRKNCTVGADAIEVEASSEARPNV